MRADKLLFQKGLATSRTQAAALIDRGIVLCDGRPIEKPSADLKETSVLILKGDAPRFVSRGGEKLEAALLFFDFSPVGMTAIDFGASTGGFTDCLLQYGAKKIYALDAGHDQLHPKLRENPAVISMENTNARYLTREQIGELCDLAVMDVSFISQKLLHPVVASLLKEGGFFISLIKPQFEVGKSGIGKGGIVKNDSLRRSSVDGVLASAASCGFSVCGLMESVIRGGDGNIEYLALFRKGR